MKRILLSTACVLALAACQSAPGDLQAQLDAEKATNADLRAQLASGPSSSNGAVGSESLVPPNAKAGECYARITQPAKFKTVSEQVIDTEASQSVSIVPGQYKTVQERILVSEASERLEVVPATYKTVEERILVTPAKTTLTKTAPKFKTVEERVLVKEAYTTWKRGGNVIAVGARALGGTILENRTSDTGEVMCLVEVPAEYRVITKRVKVSDGATREATSPAVYKTVRKRVVDQPATTRKIAIPAKYSTVTKTVEVSPASTKTTTTPATFKTVTKTVNAAPARTVWTSVLCDVNTTPGVVRRLQTALKSAGHYGGPIDGIIGSQTRGGIKSYQNAQGVKSDILTIESAKKLGII